MGITFVVSGPSGTGKSTICSRVLDTVDNLRFSISCTTRPLRDGEVEGRDYYFLSTELFEQRIGNGEFIEHAEVHGNYYGTLRSEVEQHLDAGRDVLLDIDVQGAGQIQNAATDTGWKTRTQFVFVGPPSVEVLEQRLRGRGTESQPTIRKRLAAARTEMAQWRHYDYLVINETIDDAVAGFVAIIRSERMGISRITGPAPWE